LTSSSSQSVASSSHTSISSTTPSQTSFPQTTSAPNHAWIAGAVIAPLAILAILLLSFYLWKRHKRTKKHTEYDLDSTYGKAQLDSDTNGIHELDSTPIRGEMPANEAPANEKPANEAPAVELTSKA
jgi:beta-lactamase regulating signal transducer with metallopeptidase domain